jgi:hypothetical protein
MIMLSTSLLTLNTIQVNGSSILIIISTEFQNDPSSLSMVGSLSFYTAVGLLNHNLSFPHGTSRDYAFQDMT